MTTTVAPPGAIETHDFARVRTVRWAIGVVALVLAVLLGAASAGWLGPLATCGADGVAVCVAWPGVASAGMWVLNLGTLAALSWLQARRWRRPKLVRLELVLLGVLLAGVLVDRVWRIDLALVGYDEASAASLVAAWRLHGLFPLTGIVSSIGIPNPPGWPYLLALVLLVFDSPQAVVGLGIATGLVTVILTWWIGRRWVGVWGALAGAGFYAFGFWATLLGRTGWQPVFLQLPVILCLDALLLLAVKRWPWALVIACGWLALMVQLHYIAVFFALMLPLAAWPARRVIGAEHVAAAIVTGTALLAPFFIYELNPLVRLGDLGRLLGDSGATARVDLESWNLMWTVAGNGGAAGLAVVDADALRGALGRWSQLGLIGIPLVGFGLLAAVGGWPRGWRGVLLAGWTLAPIVGLARHTLGVIFHYLFLALPGMAVCVGALVEWSGRRRSLVPRALVGAALGLYVLVSTATVWVVLRHVDRTGVYPGLARPLGINLAAADATRAVVPPGGQVLVGGRTWEVEILRFSLGYNVPSQAFDDCGEVPSASSAIYLLNSERTSAAASLNAAGAPLLARLPRPDDAFLIFGPPAMPLQTAPQTDDCRSRSS
ncbi:MAG: glycosyltransferase family 39 protein [Chloroflexota bacterium]|nr:glycosyltransferase family 39 protein [Chloroflexota bacterium]